MNAIIGDNGIITKAQLANVDSKFAGYKEELGINLVTSITEGKIEKEEEVTLLGENVRKYIPSLLDEDIGKFGIVEGRLYYIDDDILGKKAARSQNIEVMGDDLTVQDFEKNIEKSAVDGIVKNSSKDNNEMLRTVGIELITKNLENASRWNIVIETVEGKVVNKYQSGWYYIPTGTEIEGIGKITNPYIINFDTRRSKEF